MGVRVTPFLLLGAFACGGTAAEVRQPAPEPAPLAVVAPTPIAVPTSAEAKARSFAAAVRLADDGDCSEAIPLLRMLLAAYPQIEDYHLHYLAACADAVGDSTTALASRRRLVEVHDRSLHAAAAALALGIDARRRGDTAAAWPLLRRATSTHDVAVSRAARYELAEIDLESGNVRRAYETYTALREDAVGSEVGKQSKQRIYQLRQRYPELEPRGAQRRAEIEALIREADYPEALRQVNLLLATSERRQQPELLNLRARVERDSGAIEAHLQTYREIYQGYPTTDAAPEALYQEARWHWNKDSDAVANTLFRKLESTYPGSRRVAMARYAQARIAQDSGELSSATTRFRRVIELYPRSELASASRLQIAWIQYREGRWQEAAASFAALTRGRVVRRSADTIYWRARSYQRGGDPRYRRLYESIVERAPETYYSALAAERLGERTVFDAASVRAVEMPFPMLPPTLAGDYHLSRARELHRADLRRWARREVKAFKRDRGSLDRALMIDLYRSVDAHRDAIRLAGGNQDRYAEILYPLAFWDTVQSNAQRYRIDPLLALSLMRQESMFDPEARSPANARGLMQLLPSTAAQVAADIGRDGKIDLYDPQTNIELGIAHLRELADRYGDDPQRILAAYNAGAAAVAKWDARSGDRPADEWVEAISYSETRDYVKKVLTNRQKYARLYGMRRR